jgi:hypothetical protein
MLKRPEKVPEPGFYYHYKHDPQKGIRDYAYEFRGLFKHTENEEEWFADYRPLYEEASVYRVAQELKMSVVDGRPLEMWMETVTKEGKIFPRFIKITDSLVIEELRKVRRQMYPIPADF